MADGPALALQAALVAALKANAGVAALVGARVYDEPPALVAFPYVRIGEIIINPVVTDGKKAFEATFGIEAYSRPVSGRVEATRIADAVMVALEDTAPSLVGFTVAWLFFQTYAVSRMADGESYAANIAFEAMLDV